MLMRYSKRCKELFSQTLSLNGRGATLKVGRLNPIKDEIGTSLGSLSSNGQTNADVMKPVEEGLLVSLSSKEDVMKPEDQINLSTFETITRWTQLRDFNFNPSLRSMLPNMPGSSSLPSFDEVNALADYVIAKIPQDRPLKLFLGCRSFLVRSTTFRYDVINMSKIMSILISFIQNSPEANSIEIFNAKVFFRSLLIDDSISNLTKEDIISRVLKVIQSYPKLGLHKVTEDTHFIKDLGFGKWDIFDINIALRSEFKLYIPNKFVSCKHAIEYIYDHRMKRLPLKEYRKLVFWSCGYGNSEMRMIVMFNFETKAYRSNMCG